MTAPQTDTSIPPSPRLCLRIIEAHHLHCQALTHQQIADRMGCGRSTVSAYLRDFQRHRDHILHIVAGDQLLDQGYLLLQPDAPAIALARSCHFLAGPDGHIRFIAGPEIDQCMPACPRCFPELYEGDDAQPPVVNSFANRAQPTKPDFTEPELTSPDDSCPESDTTEQNLTKSDTPETEFPAHNGEFADQHHDTDEFSPSTRGVGPEFPFKGSNNPHGYLHRNAITVRYRT